MKVLKISNLDSHITYVDLDTSFDNIISDIFGDNLISSFHQHKPTNTPHKLMDTPSNKSIDFSHMLMDTQTYHQSINNLHLSIDTTCTTTTIADDILKEAKLTQEAVFFSRGEEEVEFVIVEDMSLLNVEPSNF